VDKSKTAFVAMKFEGDPWNDKRYRTIREVLNEAGYVVTRGDDLRSADIVMKEVPQQLRTADMVVIDSTGDSHNVSYEIGYCHGIPRDAESIVLLRKKEAGDVPFNYRPFRRLTYKDLRHLRRQLRHRLSLSTPLTGEQLGFEMPFITYEGAGLYGDLIADSIIASLKEQQFSGRCEYYEGNPIEIPDLYVVALGLKPVNSSGRSQSPTYEWWESLCSLIDGKVKERTEMVVLRKSDAEITIMLGIRTNLLPSGVAEFEGGKIVGLLSPQREDSWFRAAIRKVLEDGNNTMP